MTAMVIIGALTVLLLALYLSFAVAINQFVIGYVIGAFAAMVWLFAIRVRPLEFVIKVVPA